MSFLTSSSYLFLGLPIGREAIGFQLLICLTTLSFNIHDKIRRINPGNACYYSVQEISVIMSTLQNYCAGFVCW
jgi:hypothetical protein